MGASLPAEVLRLFNQAVEQDRGASARVWEPFQRWRNDPEGFVEHFFGERPYAAQRATWEELYKHRLVAWRGPRKVGKTRWIAWTVLHFLCTRPSVVITLGPSWDQVRNVLWSGIGELHGVAKGRGRPLPGEVDATQIRLGPRHFAVGRATNKPGKLQGIHGSVVMPEDPDEEISEEELDELLEAAMGQAGSDIVELLVICDESAEIPQPLLDSIAGSVQGPNAYWVHAFNPTIPSDADHMAARIFRDPGRWRRIAVHPEPVDDPVGADRRFDAIPVGLQRPSWRRDMEYTWGRESNLYKAHVLGLFAGASLEQQVVPLELLEAATLHDVRVATGRSIGVDLSGMGEDRSVAVLVVDGVMVARHEWAKCTAPTSRETIKALMVRWGEGDVPVPASCVHIDRGTFGSAVCEELANEGYHVDGVDFGGGPVGDWAHLHGETAFVNRRAEMHWNARRLLQDGYLQVPRELHGRRNPAWDQAQWATYEDRFRSGETQLLIEPKDAIKKRHGRSPDDWDAVLLATCRPVERPRLRARRR